MLTIYLLPPTPDCVSNYFEVTMDYKRLYFVVVVAVVVVFRKRENV